MKAKLTPLALAAVFAFTVADASAQSSAEAWKTADGIAARIVAPSFRDKAFPITAFGAVADGRTDCTGAIRRAIEACHDDGGGHVEVPAGEFLTGAVHLRSNVDLHLAKGATLRFYTDPAKYLPAVLTRNEGIECMGYSPLIYAFEQENVGVTGEGTLDGGADWSNWWGWVKKSAAEKLPHAPQSDDRKQLEAFGEAGTPVAERVFGEGHHLRPAFVQPYRCRNVVVGGVTVVRSPMWEINPVLCQNVTVRDVKIDSDGPNNDGCDPESCQDVLIENCTFRTGDDCIAIKSGRNADGRRVHTPSENILIRGCTMADGHGGVTVGSEVSGDCRNIFAEDCRMDSPRLERALRLKTNAMRGGTIENVYLRNVTVGEVKDAVVQIDCLYEEGARGPFAPVVRNIAVENVTSRKSRRALSLRGLPVSPIRNVSLTDCTFAGVKEEDVVENVEGLEKTNVVVRHEN